MRRRKVPAPPVRNRIRVHAAGLVACMGLAWILANGARAQSPGTFDFRQITLDNGLRVITLEDFSCPIVAVQLWYHVGSKDEDPQRQGFAHMFEHMMFRGTDRLGPTDHFDYIRRTGGSCNAYTAFDQTVYVQELPANQLELTLWLEAERMAFLKIDQQAFDTERKVVEEERRLGLNRPYGTLLEKVLEALYQRHPYRWAPIGRIPHLRAAAVQELRDFWMRYYVPNNATLVVAGAVRHEVAQDLARRYFGWIPRYPDPPRIEVAEPPLEARAVDFQEDNAPAPMVGLLFRTVPLGHEDYYPLQLLATILGGGHSSRLYRELVAEKRLAVMAAATAFALEQDGFFAAGAVLTPLGGNLDQVQEAVEAQLERLRTEPVTQRELTKARNQLLKQLVTENLTVESKATVLGQAAVLQGDPARVNQRLEIIRRATPESLLEVARRHLARERQLVGRVRANLLGTLLGRKKSEDDAPITAEPETAPPPPGRPGLTRPADWPAQPPIAPLLDFEATPRHASRTLANGLKVMVVENHELPFVTVQLRMHCGAWTEEAPGAASLACQMLSKGTARHTEAELADELETYGIAFSGSAGMDTASASVDCLSEHLERAVHLLAEMVLTPTFPEEEFEKLRDQVLTGLRIASAEPSYVADRELRRRLFGPHPYARTETGEVEDVSARTPEDLKRWWSRAARPDACALIVSGDVNLERAVELAQAAFGEWRPGAAGASPADSAGAPGLEGAEGLPTIEPPQRTHIYLVDRPGVQAQIRFAQLGPTRRDPDYFVSRVVSEYFGGAFSSRLNESIRVRKGLTYGAGGGFSAQRFAGQFRISTFSKVESAVEAVQAVIEEIERLRSEPPGAEELSKTRSYMIGSFVGQRETPQAVAADLWLLEYEKLPPDYFETMLRRTASVTADECLELARQRVDPSRMVIVVVGPAARLKEGLERIAPVTVVRADQPASPPPDEE